MKGCIAVVLLIIACVSAQTFIRTVENCSNCLNTAGSSVCSGDIAHFTSVCCASDETTRDCFKGNVCTNNIGALSAVSRYLLCPSPTECTTTDYFINEFDESLEISIPVIPTGLFCRVRIFTNVDEKFTASFTSKVVSQASIEVFRTFLNETTDGQEFESINNINVI